MAAFNNIISKTFLLLLLRNSVKQKLYHQRINYSVSYLIKITLINRDKNKGKLQSFVNFTKKKSNDDFLGFTFHKKALQNLSSDYHYVQTC